MASPKTEIEEDIPDSAIADYIRKNFKFIVLVNQLFGKKSFAMRICNNSITHELGK